MWRSFRSLPVWLQILCWVLFASIPVGALTRATAPDVPRARSTQTPTPQMTENVVIATPTPTPTVPVMAASVTRVIDGDTIEVRLDGNGRTERVRFIGVDTPERGQGLYAAAAAYTRETLAHHDDAIFLQTDVEERDRYGRLLAYVWLRQPETGDDVEATAWTLNAFLMKKGLAKTLTIPPNVAFADLFASLQRDARAAELGLWTTIAGAS